MNPQKTLRLAELTDEMVEMLRTAVVLASKIRRELDGEGSAVADDGVVGANLFGSDHRPLLDHSTLSVAWDNKWLHLGNTRGFRFLDRLAQRPNHYVTYEDLAQDVWDNQKVTDASIRSVVCHLRRILRNGDMSGLAAAIRGHNGHYILEL